MTAVSFPAIVAGREIYRDDIVSRFDGQNGSAVLSMPRIQDSDLKDIFKWKEAMNRLPLEEVFVFLQEVGRLWSNPEYHLLKEALELMEKITQFSRAELTDDFGYIPPICDRQLFMDNFISGDFENPDILTRWVERSGSLVKAMPRGSFVHILAGNVPGVELMSLARGLVTGNLNILKTAAANPASPVYLLKSFIEVDPDHPVTRATSAFRWERGSDIEKQVFSKVESACVWGGAEALHATWKYARPGLEILDYGPKRSMVFIGSETIADKERLIKLFMSTKNLNEMVVVLR
jgi:long-chain-fatty-acyl-CoA reductase